MRKVESATVRHAHKFVIKRWSNVREVQWHVIVWILVMGFLIAATGLQLMWYQQSYRTNVPARDGTYAEAVLGPINTLDPLFASTSAEQSAARLMFSSLLQYDNTGHLGNDLATGVTVDNTHTVYTVTIRPDVKWHDGVSLTASDVAFTINLIKNPNTRTTISGWRDVGVKVLNDTTIEFTLASVYAAFEHALTFPIVPEHILGSIAPASIRENLFSQNPIGSGPFKLKLVQNVDNSANHKVIYMSRNDGYYGGVAKLARFQLHVYDSTDAIVKALSLNEVNAAADLSMADIDRVNAKQYSNFSNSIQSGVYAILNTRGAITSDITVRRALEQATNVGVLRDQLGAASLDLPFINGQLTGDIPKVAGYNADNAKALLDGDGWRVADNGVRQKDGKELRLSVVTLKNSEFERDLELIAGQWRAIGVAVDTKIVDPADIAENVVQSILQPRSFDVLIYQLNIGADPDVYAYWHSSQATVQGANFANYSNLISDDALSSARVRVDATLRNAKYLTFARQWVNDVPAIGLYQSKVQYVQGHNTFSFDKTDNLVLPVDRYSSILNWAVGTQTVYKTP